MFNNGKAFKKKARVFTSITLSKDILLLLFRYCDVPDLVVWRRVSWWFYNNATQHIVYVDPALFFFSLPQYKYIIMLFQLYCIINAQNYDTIGN